MEKEIFSRKTVVTFGDNNIAIYEMNVEGTISNFIVLLCDDCKPLAIPVEDVMWFCLAHPDQIATDLMSTFFLCKKEKKLVILRVTKNIRGVKGIEEIPFNSKEKWQWTWSPGHKMVVVLPPE